MQHKYSNILSPVKVGNYILKNRLVNAKCVANYLQGPQNFPTETTIKFAADLARNGASIVTCSPGTFSECSTQSMFTSVINMDDRAVHREFRRMIDRIHAYGSLASASTMNFVPNNIAISTLRDLSVLPESVKRPGPESCLDRDGKPLPEISRDEIKQFIDRFVRCCRKLQAVGFDMINIYMCYNASFLAKSLSPVFNQREDEYGGNLENRARLCRELMQAIKQECGKDFVIEIQLSGREYTEGGYTTADFLQYCRQFEGLADIFQLRAWNADMTHVSSYTCKKDYPTNLVFAEAFKKAGIKGLCAPVGGFQDLELINGFIGEGRTDLVALARAFICDDEYGIKLQEGRGEDVVPCIRCDCCHQAYCSVNPKISIAQSWGDMFREPRRVKKVAVIGGGPAGMEAARTAAERGHRVTLFEKTATLGGQLSHADYMPEDKWALHDFKEYLVCQMDKYNIDVRLNTEATPEIISKGGFDAVIAACGSVPRIGPVIGAETALSPMDVFGQETRLGAHVAVVGGAMAAVDTALYLARSGHQVTLITRQRQPAYDMNSHGAMAFIKSFMSMEKICVITEAQTTAIGRGFVTYATKQGESVTVTCDDVVFSAGRRALTDECFRFSGLTPEFFVVGDANTMSFKNNGDGHGDIPKADDSAHGNVRNCIFTARTAASNL